VIAGDLHVDGKTYSGPIRGLSTEPQYVDVVLPAGGRFEQPLAESHTAFVYPYEGSVRVLGDSVQAVPTHAAGLLGSGSMLMLEAEQATRLLLLVGRALREPIVQYGPFVMNTRAEIEQAVRDYQAGALTS